MSARAGVSVVIPTHNRAALVTDAVTSVLAQDWDPLEVIVVDDASSDDTVERLDEIGRRDDRLVIIAREGNGGESVARNQGILAASQDYVALLDSDNRFMAGKLARQMPALLEAEPGSVSFSGYLLVDGARQTEVLMEGWSSDSEAVIEVLLRHCAVNTSTFLAPRRLLVEHGLFRTDLPCCQDHDLWLRLAALGHPFVYVPEALTLYRVHDGSVSGDLARVATYEELVVRDFLSRSDLPSGVRARSGSARAHWALSGAERFLQADRPGDALRALGRAMLASPRSVRPGWVRLALRALLRSRRAEAPAVERRQDA